MELFLSNPLLIFLWVTVKTWWWLFLPFLLFGPTWFLYKWWRMNAYDSTHDFWVLYEIRVPQSIPRPMKAMENVFAGFWQLYDPPNRRERVLEGQYQYGMAIEIVSTEGEVRFYLRVPVGSEKLIESAVYSQYPDAELIVVEDYTQKLPQDIPNKDWEFWGASIKLAKDDAYPIKTYPTFFETSPGDKEEAKVDPMAMLIENISRAETNEHFWIQFVITPISTREADYTKPGKELIDKLANRPAPEKPPGIFEDMGKVGHMLATGKESVQVEEEKRNELYAPELRLTPGEREVVSAVEEKISKPMFSVHSRFMYIAKRDVYSSPAKALAFGFYNQFQTVNLNAFAVFFTTKVHTIPLWFLDARRRYLKKRRMFRNYVYRLPPYFPRKGGTFMLNIEEMATIFHFPGQIVTSVSVPTIDTKKGEAPPELPTE